MRLLLVEDNRDNMANPADSLAGEAPAAAGAPEGQRPPACLFPRKLAA